MGLLRPRVEEWVRKGDEVRVVVGRGEGRGFCAGGDVKGEFWTWSIRLEIGESRKNRWIWMREVQESGCFGFLCEVV